ncbi:MAG: VanW family protein [Eubacteriales bacterium]|nr:VanW family protein [Eubacteriales bacterium]
MDKKIKKRILRGIGFLILLVLLYCGWCAALKDDVIWEKAQVNGVSVEALTRAQAEKAIEDRFLEEYKDLAMTIVIQDLEYEAYPFPALEMDCREELDALYALGHGSWYTRGLDRIHLMRESGETKRITIEPDLAHPEALSSVLSYTEIGKVDTVRETACRITDSSLIIRKGKRGVRADMEKLEEALWEAIQKGDFESRISCPVVEISPEELDLKAYYDRIHREPQDAYLDEENEYAVVPSKDGVTFDLKEAGKEFARAREGAVVVIPLERIRPEVTTEDMDGIVYRDVLGSHITYGGGSDNRINNLTLAARACDGITLMPGEVFSYNETLGERTAERGYLPAGVFVNGQHAEDYGGGICQVSTTLFVACLYANLEIVDRSNHSGRVDYVPEGMDAAVSWGSPDFKFRNNTDYPIRISAAYEDGAVNIKIYGTSVSTNTVKITTEQLDALSYKTYRSTYDFAGNLLGTEEVCTSHYRT